MNVGIASADVLAKFEKDENGNLINERLEIEREKRRNFSKRQSDRAKSGWEKRKNKSKPRHKSGKGSAHATALPKKEDVNDIVIEEKDIINKWEKKLVYPFDTQEFKDRWQAWRNYRFKEHGSKYRSQISEQAALKQIGKHPEHIAMEGIEITMGKGWMGFDHGISTLIKNQSNGKQRSSSQVVADGYRINREKELARKQRSQKSDGS